MKRFRTNEENKMVETIHEEMIFDAEISNNL